MSKSEEERLQEALRPPWWEFRVVSTAEMRLEWLLLEVHSNPTYRSIARDGETVKGETLC